MQGIWVACVGPLPCCRNTCPEVPVPSLGTEAGLHGCVCMGQCSFSQSCAGRPGGGCQPVEVRRYVGVKDVQSLHPGRSLGVPPLSDNLDVYSLLVQV